MKVLVVFGSERGGTAGLANMIADGFRRQGWDAEVRDAAAAEPLPAVAGYDAVLVGGALYLNRWHRDARRFVRANRRALTDTRVWLFSSGPLDDTARAGDIAPVPQVQTLARAVEARGHMTFGGRLATDARGFVARSMARSSAGDWRDAAHVEEWVQEICRAVNPPAVRLPRQRTAAAAETEAATSPRGRTAR